MGRALGQETALCTVFFQGKAWLDLHPHPSCFLFPELLLAVLWLWGGFALNVSKFALHFPF